LEIFPFIRFEITWTGLINIDSFAVVLVILCTGLLGILYADDGIVECISRRTNRHRQEAQNFVVVRPKTRRLKELLVVGKTLNL